MGGMWKFRYSAESSPSEGCMVDSVDGYYTQHLSTFIWEKNLYILKANHQGAAHPGCTPHALWTHRSRKDAGHVHCRHIAVEKKS